MTHIVTATATVQVAATASHECLRTGGGGLSPNAAAGIGCSSTDSPSDFRSLLPEAGSAGVGCSVVGRNNLAHRPGFPCSASMSGSNSSGNSAETSDCIASVGSVQGVSHSSFEG